MQVLCESPNIILNPSLRKLLLQCTSYYVVGNDFELTNLDKQLIFSNWHKFKYLHFNKKRLNPTHENLGEFYCYDCETGVCYPIFIEVPCGNCLICRNKKVNSWKFRATCESATSSNNVYFVTLTYAPKFFPRYGVHKSAIQLFMKRLRIKLSRMGIKHKIKYFAVGEYGKQSKRPHYHLLLWNFPDDDKEHFPNITSILHFIEECWSVYKVDKNFALVYGEDKHTPLREFIGFCQCKYCDKGAYGYVMKYMLKRIDPPPGMNECFYTCSKFIGAEYCARYKDFYEQHPEHLEISVTDPLSGELVTCSLPQYFVNKYFPTLSQLISKPLRDAYDLFLDLLSKRYSCITSAWHSEYDLLGVYPAITPTDRLVLDNYHKLIFGVPFDKLTVDYCVCRDAYNKGENWASGQYFNYTEEIDSLSRVLLAGLSEIDVPRVIKSYELREKRNNRIVRLGREREIIDIDVLSRKLQRDRDRAIQRELL